ncbi:MAG: lipid-A-disaccharide synthase, partial [Cyclobacteriaceae bacterium]|nr:lipid-A-disaccharide synthase [Cyclobacteriaceae bacterium]
IQEINHILPVFLRVAKHFPERHFLLAAVSTIPHVKYSEVKQIPNISLVYEDTYNLLAHSRAAIVTSGTATLETALWGVPQIVVYKTSSFSYLIARLVIQVPFISLVNLILNEELIKEFIQSECTPANIIGELRKIVEDHEYHDTVKNGYSRLKEILHEGNVSENAAEKMVNYLIATRKNTS